jgi:hypothetical protein
VDDATEVEACAPAAGIHTATTKIDAKKNHAHFFISPPSRVYDGKQTIMYCEVSGMRRRTVFEERNIVARREGWKLGMPVFGSGSV